MTLTLTKPVAFLIFNRPDLTARVFAAIRAARPPRLLIVADGPRPSHPDDASRCAATRAIVEPIDWPCQVSRNYSDVNLGCGKRVSSGLDWVFSEVEEAIILEDDCLPNPDFFRYCEELLDYYKDNERVMHIGGANLLNNKADMPYSYRFSKYAHVWGWASWRRAWRHYDFAMKRWPVLRDSKDWLKALDSPAEESFWRWTFNRAYAGKIDTWDHMWTFAIWARDGIAVTPTPNLISNLGFRADATHTFGESDLAQRPLESLETIRHPNEVTRDRDSDRLVFASMGGGYRQHLTRVLRAKISRVFGSRED